MGVRHAAQRGGVRRLSAYELLRFRTRDGGETTVYLVRHPLAATRVSVVCFAPSRRGSTTGAAPKGTTRRSSRASSCATRTGRWARCGSAARPSPHEPVEEPWAAARACVHVAGGVRLAPLGELPDGGDLVQAGPLLVHDGRSLMDGEDREGFSAGSAQFDSDITAERHPRCALGVGEDELLAVCCDGRRSGVDAGLDLGELARLLISFGAREAINLDGGGSATLVHRGHLLNRPYSNHDQPAPESRPVVTALLFEPA